MSTKQIFVAKFISPGYPEDNTTYGAFEDEAEAETRCDTECNDSRRSNPNRPEYYFNQRHNYWVEEITLYSKEESQ